MLSKYKYEAAGLDGGGRQGVDPAAFTVVQAIVTGSSVDFVRLDHGFDCVSSFRLPSFARRDPAPLPGEKDAGSFLIVLTPVPFFGVNPLKRGPDRPVRPGVAIVTSPSHPPNRGNGPRPQNTAEAPPSAAPGPANTLPANRS